MVVLGCFDCKKKCANYMVEPSVWRQAFPNYAEVKSCNRDVFVELCFDCLSRRLGRALTLTDFSDAPVNEGMRLGYRIALQGGGLTSEEVFSACRNIGVDLGCGGCAAVFYTGVGDASHEEHCVPAREDQEPIHGYFELSYSSYLVLPRSILQSAPTWWQNAFVSLLRKLEEWFDCPVGNYWVRAKQGSKFVHDSLADYERGRRRIPLKTTEKCPAGGSEPVGSSLTGAGG
jgi:hypothetical protein